MYIHSLLQSFSQTLGQKLLHAKQARTQKMNKNQILAFPHSADANENVACDVYLKLRPANKFSKNHQSLNLYIQKRSGPSKSRLKLKDQQIRLYTFD